jgi:hypothetical protein
MIERATMGLRTEQRKLAVELRMSPDERSLSGYAALYDTDSEDMGYIESLAPGVFQRSLDDDDEVLALVEHDPQRLLGRRSAGTLRLDTDKRGLTFEIDIPDTTLGRDVREQVRRGDLSQMSFAFSLYDETGEVMGQNADGRRTRRITSARLHDVSIVAQPAYTETSVDVRSTRPMSETTRIDEVRRLTAEMRSILDGDMDAASTEKYDRLEQRLQEAETEIREHQRQTRLARAERLLDEPTQAAPSPASAAQPDVESRAYSEAFFAALTGRATVEQRDMLAGTGSGANVVPTEMEAAIVEMLDDPTTMRGICSVTAARGDREIPVETAIGSGGWLAEQGTISTSDVTLTKKSASPKSYGTAIAWSSLMSAQSVVGVDAYFGRAVGRTMAQGLEDGYVNGSGTSNEPEGLVTALGTATFMDIATDGGDGIIDAVHSIEPQYRSGGRWVMNDTTLSTIRKLKNSDGDYLLKHSAMYSDIRDGTPYSLYGYPVTICAAMSDTQCLFGNLERAYRIFDWGSTTILVDPYTSASTMTTTLWAWRQTDGVLIDSNAIGLFDTDAS